MYHSAFQLLLKSGLLARVTQESCDCLKMETEVCKKKKAFFEDFVRLDLIWAKLNGATVAMNQVI